MGAECGARADTSPWLGLGCSPLIAPPPTHTDAPPPQRTATFLHAHLAAITANPPQQQDKRCCLSSLALSRRRSQHLHQIPAGQTRGAGRQGRPPVGARLGLGHHVAGVRRVWAAVHHHPGASWRREARGRRRRICAMCWGGATTAGHLATVALHARRSTFIWAALLQCTWHEHALRRSKSASRA